MSQFQREPERTSRLDVPARKVRIRTPRFELASLIPDDATPRYSSWFDQPAVARHIQSAAQDHTVETLRSFILKRALRDDVLFLGIFTREVDEHIGNIKYEPVDRVRGYATMGIMIGQPEWRGQGVAGEVIGHSAAWLQKSFGIKEILLGVEKDNLAAIAAYKKVGFRIAPTTHVTLEPSAISMVWFLDHEKCGPLARP